MLQAVIRKHHIHRTLIDQSIHRPFAVSAHHNWHTQFTPDQKRLITHHRRGVDFRNAMGFRAMRTAIATADHANAIAPLCQPFSETNQHGSLAGAARRQATDHDHGDTHGGAALGCSPLTPAMDHPPHRPGQRDQTPGQQAVAVPYVIQQALQRAPHGAHEAAKPCW